MRWTNFDPAYEVRCCFLFCYTYDGEFRPLGGSAYGDHDPGQSIPPPPPPPLSEEDHRRGGVEQAPQGRHGQEALRTHPLLRLLLLLPPLLEVLVEEPVVGEHVAPDPLRQPRLPRPGGDTERGGLPSPPAVLRGAEVVVVVQDPKK